MFGDVGRGPREAIDGVERANAAVTGTDYSLFTRDEKLQAGLLVNATLTLAQLINRELSLNV